MKLKKQAKQYKKEYKAYARMQKKRARKIKGHPFVVPVITFLFLFFVSMVAFIGLSAQTIGAGDSHVVQFSIDGEKQILPTRATTVAKLLKRLEIKVGKHDVIEPQLKTPIIEDNFEVNLYRAKPVIVVEGKREVSLLAAITSPKNVAAKAGFKLYPEDRVILASAEDVLKDGIIGHKIIIDHATPVTLNLFGKTLSLRTHAKTVKELLIERGLGDAKYSVFPPPNTKLKKDSVVFVTNPGQKVRLEEIVIPQGEVFVDDFNLPLGQTQVKNPGRPGKKVIVYSVSKKNPNQQKKLQEIIVTEPVDKVIARGRKIEFAFEGGFDGALALLRSCEGSYNSNTGNGYYGAYQFDIGTWGNYGGYANASQAPPIIQDQKAKETYIARGWQPWPACSQKLGLQDVYR
jgi:resuscitation-promoting factor RpfB